MNKQDGPSVGRAGSQHVLAQAGRVDKDGGDTRESRDRAHGAHCASGTLVVKRGIYPQITQISADLDQYLFSSL